MKNIEKAIQAAIIRWVIETYPDIIITATANERSYRETEQIGSLGIPDLILIHPRNGVFLLELKRKKGKLLASQIEWNAAFDLITFDYPCSRAVAYGYTQAQGVIMDWLLHY